MSWDGVPTTLFRAVKLHNGQVVCVDPRVLHLTTLVVRNSDEYDHAVITRWCASPQEALDDYEKLEQEVGNEAAYRAYRDQFMSAPAQREADAYEKTVPLAHVPVIPEARK
jgi:hypothetical protein